MLRRAPCSLLALVCGLVVVACGSSRPARTARRAPARTVTRTVTRPAATIRSAPAPTGSSSGATASSAPTLSGLRQCVAAGLALHLLGGAGATGHGELGVALEDVGPAPCRTGGYPGVEFLDGAGRGLPTTPEHTTDDFFGRTTLRELTVEPGREVSFRLGVDHVGSGGSDAGCVTAHGLQVIAPNDTQTLRLSLPGISECGGTVTVSPVQPGTSAFR